MTRVTIHASKQCWYQGWKNLGLKRFLYEYRTRTQAYDPKAHEKHPIHGTPYLTKDKSPVSVGEEHHVKNDDEIDKFHQ